MDAKPGFSWKWPFSRPTIVIIVLYAAHSPSLKRWFEFYGKRSAGLLLPHSRERLASGQLEACVPRQTPSSRQPALDSPISSFE